MREKSEDTGERGITIGFLKELKEWNRGSRMNLCSYRKKAEQRRIDTDKLADVVIGR